MRSFLNFFFKYNYWFLFVLLEVISFVLLFRFNNYQGSVYFTSAGHVTGRFYNFFGNIGGYLNLREDNDMLFSENVKLKQDIAHLQAELSAFQVEANVDSMAHDSLMGELFSTYRIIGGEVVKSSIGKKNNWITINRGSADGICPEMGVFSDRGVVGIVYLVSQHYSLVIPVLNDLSNISCKIKSSNYFCSLKWEGDDATVAYLVDVPRHAKFFVGDTVVTSGYSSIFPKGINVGCVQEIKDSPDALSYHVKILLATDFSNLSYVYVVGNNLFDEQKELEKQTSKKK